VARDELLETTRDGFVVSTDPNRLDLDAVERFLRASYWAADRPRELIERSLRDSLCFGLYEAGTGRQIGLTRIVTDYATFAWLCDVFIEPQFRGRKLGAWMMEVALAHPCLRSVGRWLLATLDAHDLYRRYDFTPLARPQRWMERTLSKSDCTQ
jgi:GNAT superfamily N-acetyltransferase